MSPACQLAWRYTPSRSNPVEKEHLRGLDQRSKDQLIHLGHINNLARGGDETTSRVNRTDAAQGLFSPQERTTDPLDDRTVLAQRQERLERRNAAKQVENQTANAMPTWEQPGIGETQTSGEVMSCWGGNVTLTVKSKLYAWYGIS